MPELFPVEARGRRRVVGGAGRAQQAEREQGGEGSGRCHADHLLPRSPVASGVRVAETGVGAARRVRADPSGPRNTGSTSKMQASGPAKDPRLRVSAPSRSSRNSFAPLLPAAFFAVTPPPEGTTRWHGTTTIGIGAQRASSPPGRQLPARLATSPGTSRPSRTDHAAVASSTRLCRTPAACERPVQRGPEPWWIPPWK